MVVTCSTFRVLRQALTVAWFTQSSTIAVESARKIVELSSMVSMSQAFAEREGL
jgi:hypothetical protein